MEPNQDPAGDLAGALDRIEAEVAGGHDDLGALGFWRAVAQVKRDPALVRSFADQVGRIDAAAFTARVRPRFPVWLGNLVLLAGIVLGAAALALAHVSPSFALGLDPTLLAGWLCLFAGLAWSLSVHAPAHWVVGRAVGIRFLAYFFGGPFPPRPGIKTDYATYLRTPARTRAWFHASGALATKAAPFLALAASPWDLIPWWSVLALLGWGVLQIVTDLVFSVRSSDWKRFKREIAIAREPGALSGARSG